MSPKLAAAAAARVRRRPALAARRSRRARATARATRISVGFNPLAVLLVLVVGLSRHRRRPTGRKCRRWRRVVFTRGVFRLETFSRDCQNFFVLGFLRVAKLNYELTPFVCVQKPRIFCLLLIELVEVF